MTGLGLGLDPATEALLREIDRENTPVLSCRPWRPVTVRTFHWENTSREVSPGVFEPATIRKNVCQINAETYRTGDAAARARALIDLKRSIELAIWGDQPMDAGGADRARRTAGMRALGVRDPFSVRIAFLRCFVEQDLPGGMVVLGDGEPFDAGPPRTMIVCEWGLMASLLPDAEVPEPRLEGAAA